MKKSPEQFEFLAENTSNEKIEDKIGKEWQENSPEINWEQICLVRALHNIDQLRIDSEGRLKATPLIEVTEGEIPRLTSHWFLNNKVVSHEGGSWLTSSLIIIAPGKPTIELNGNPLGLSSVDTWWDKDITVPSKSVIFYSGEFPEEFKKAKGIELIKLLLPEEIILKISKLKTQLEELYKVDPGSEEIKTKEDELYQLSEKIDKLTEKTVEEKIKAMGYTVFQSSLLYSGMKGLDDALVALAEKEKILFGLHSYSPIGSFEKFTLKLADMNRDKEYGRRMFARTESGNRSNFAMFIEGFERMFLEEDGGDTVFPISKEQKEVITKKQFMNVFLGELSRTIGLYSEEIQKDDSSITALIHLFSEHPDIFKTLRDWASQEEVIKRFYKEIEELSESCRFSPEEETAIQQFDNGEIPILPIRRQVPLDKNENFGKVLGLIMQKKLEEHLVGAILTFDTHLDLNTHVIEFHFKPLPH